MQSKWHRAVQCPQRQHYICTRRIGVSSFFIPIRNSAAQSSGKTSTFADRLHWEYSQKEIWLSASRTITQAWPTPFGSVPRAT